MCLLEFENVRLFAWHAVKGGTDYVCVGASAMWSGEQYRQKLGISVSPFVLRCCFFEQTRKRVKSQTGQESERLSTCLCLFVLLAVMQCSRYRRVPLPHRGFE